MCTRRNTSMAGILALSVAVAFECRGQSAFYARVGLEVAQVQPPRAEFALSAARHPSLTLGQAFTDRHAIELRLNRITAEGTEPSRPGVEAPYTIAVRATAVDLGYIYRKQLGRFEPRMGAGFLWIPVSYSWQSDTPTETARTSLFGIISSFAVAIQLPGPFSAVGRAAYQHAGEARSPTRIGLSGVRLEGGLELGR